MSPLRDNLEQARSEYGKVRYRGNLAADVLGKEAAEEPSHSFATSPRRGWRDYLAIAAALALGMSITFVVMKNRTGTEVAKVEPTPTHTTVGAIPPATPSNEVATDTNSATEITSFTAVPSLSATVASAGTSDTTNQTVEAVASATDFSLNVPSSPMLFSLASLAEAEQTTTNTTTSNESATDE